MDQVPQGPVIGKIEPTEVEPIVLSTRRHLFGLFALYVEVIVGVVVAAGLIIFLLPSIMGIHKQNATAFGALGAVILLILSGLVLVIATRVYLQSQLVVTTKNLTQVTQVGLFNRKISKLSLEDVEDVSAQQKGLFATMFNYGTIFVETAGEQANFHFEFCPRPNEVARQISIVEQQFNNHRDNQNP